VAAVFWCISPGSGGVQARNIELVILDYQMPEMSGTSLAAQLKTARSKVKVVLFTGTLHVPTSELSPVDAVVSKSDAVDR
jgi:FixJ family two-component response regulator